MSSDFERFIAIDWSGAKGDKHASIAVASIDLDSDIVHLRNPDQGHSWSRQAVADFIAGQIAQKRCLMGIDCAFSLSKDIAGAYLKAKVPHVFDLWALIDELCDTEENDFYAGAFWQTEPYARDFWVHGKRPHDFQDAHRETEWAVRKAGFGAPESPFKLIGAKQVGKGGLAGMRMLHSFKKRYYDQFAIWPFEQGASKSVMCEIYPRLFIRKAGFGNQKLRGMDALNQALSFYQARIKPKKNLNDHESDAIISAAGMKQAELQDRALSSMKSMSIKAREFEGWIYGCPVLKD